MNRQLQGDDSADGRFGFSTGGEGMVRQTPAAVVGLMVLVFGALWTDDALSQGSTAIHPEPLLERAAQTLGVFDPAELEPALEEAPKWGVWSSDSCAQKSLYTPSR